MSSVAAWKRVQHSASEGKDTVSPEIISQTEATIDQLFAQSDEGAVARLFAQLGAFALVALLQEAFDDFAGLFQGGEGDFSQSLSLGLL